MNPGLWRCEATEFTQKTGRSLATALEPYETSPPTTSPRSGKRAIEISPGSALSVAVWTTLSTGRGGAGGKWAEVRVRAPTGSWRRAAGDTTVAGKRAAETVRGRGECTVSGKPSLGAWRTTIFITLELVTTEPGTAEREEGDTVRTGRVLRRGGRHS